MIILNEKEYDLMKKKGHNIIYVNYRRGQSLHCPFCFGKLKCRDTRKRIFKLSSGQRLWLQIKRVKCEECGHLQTLLPDCAVPYKHYSRYTINQVLEYKEDGTDLEIAAEESTINRWKKAYMIYTPTLHVHINK